MDVRELIKDVHTPVEEKAQMLMDIYFSKAKKISEKEYEIIRAILEAFIHASCPTFMSRFNKNGEVYLKAVYKYIDDKYPEIEDKYYKNNGGGLHGYIRYLIQKYTKGTVVYSKQGEKLHIFTTFGSGKGKYILKDLLDETEDEVAIEKRSDITIRELESKVNDIIYKYSEYRKFFIIFREASEEIVIPSQLIDGGKIIIYMNEQFESKLRKISSKLRKVTNEFVMYLASEIAIQMCCTATKGSLLGYNTEHFTRELMNNFNNLRMILYPLTDYRII